MIALPGIGGMVLDAMFAGRWREAGEIARELGSRVTVDPAPRGYLLVLWGSRSVLCEGNPVQIPLGVAEITVVVARSSGPAPALWGEGFGPIEVVTETYPARVDVELERAGTAVRFEVFDASGEMRVRDVVGDARGRRGDLVGVDLARRLRSGAHEIQHALGDLNRQRTNAPAMGVFGTPGAACGCVYALPCALHGPYL